jgi:hypothetical protein
MSARPNIVRGSLAALVATAAIAFAVPGIADAQPSGGGGGDEPVRCWTGKGFVEAGDEVTTVIKDAKTGKVLNKKTEICGNDGKMHEVAQIGGRLPKNRAVVVTTSVKAKR